MTKSKGLLATVRDALNADSVGRRKDGSFVARHEFFYRHGFDEVKWQAVIEKRLQAAGLKYQVIEAYEQWRPFNGGASTERSSHWGVVFKIL